MILKAYLKASAKHSHSVSGSFHMQDLFVQHSLRTLCAMLLYMPVRDCKDTNCIGETVKELCMDDIFVLAG